MRSTVVARGAQRGFTLVELLVAAAIFIVLLGALTGLFVSSSRAYQRTGDISLAIQDEEAILQLLRYEFALAGYHGLGSGGPAEGTQTLTISRTGDSDVVTIRYVEDEYVPSGPEQREVTFSVDPTSGMLVRREPGTVDQEMVGGVELLQVTGYIRRDRGIVPVMSQECNGYCEVPQALAGLLLRVAFADGSEWQFPVGLYNPQVIGGAS